MIKACSFKIEAKLFFIKLNQKSFCPHGSRLYFLNLEVWFWALLLGLDVRCFRGESDVGPEDER